MFNPKIFLKLLALLSFGLIIGCAGSKTSKSIEQASTSEFGEKDVFIIKRTFNADIKTVFEMWVNPDLFSKWLGPSGASMHFIKVGVKEGSSSQWSMTMADGQTKYGKLNYKKIKPHHLLVYTQNFCDKDGRSSKPPFSLTYPDVLLTTVTFSEEAAKKTKVTVKWQVYGDATQTERHTFNEKKPVMAVGWSASFDKLDALLELER